MAQATPYRIQHEARGQVGMVCPFTLKFATVEEAEVVAQRYRNAPSLPGRYTVVKVDRKGYIVARTA